EGAFGDQPGQQPQAGQGNLLAGSPGQSNLDKLFGGGQKPTPAQQQPTEEMGSQQKGDAPPPRS
ncbi:MAG: single-stranded DNA-binding protein, partial [Pseudomonadota bacterium]